MVETKPRTIPGVTDECEHCGRTIVWAVTVAGPYGAGGKSQPFDPAEDQAGRVALIPRHGGQLFARALLKDETHDAPVEYLGIPHVATCPRRRVDTDDLENIL